MDRFGEIMNRSIIEYFNENNSGVWNDTKQYVSKFIKRQTEPIIKPKQNNSKISKDNKFSAAISDYLKGPLDTIRKTRKRYNI